MAPVYGIDERMLPVTRARLAEPAEPPAGHLEGGVSVTVQDGPMRPPT